MVDPALEPWPALPPDSPVPEPGVVPPEGTLPTEPVLVPGTPARSVIYATGFIWPPIPYITTKCLSLVWMPGVGWRWIVLAPPEPEVLVQL